MSDLALRCAGVGKMYKTFASRRDNLFDALGMPQRRRRGETRYRAFWALREIDLELERGKRLGVIGRNGAGKSTLLKLLTGNLAPTEGTLEVHGSVQALIDIGTTFHPEFTGYENINATLAYEGLTRTQIAAAVEDIADFTELGEFLAQPLKTYSLGMQTRLAFATATAVWPEILLIDEILGAGDAYFISKSLERMQRITESGTSMLIVSHSMQQIAQLCEQAIWLDRGQIVMNGPSLEVVKAYERHMRQLDDRRIQERNRKRHNGATTDSLERSDLALMVRVAVAGQAPAALDVGDVRLLRDGVPTDVIEVGAPQDIEQSTGAFVVLGEGSAWSTPHRLDGRYTRSLSPNGAPAIGSLAFYLYHVDAGAHYQLDIVHRARGGATASVETWRHGELAETVDLPGGRPGVWQETRIPLAMGEPEDSADGQRGRIARSHWPAEGSLQITDARLTDAAGRSCAVFQAGDELRLDILFSAAKSGRYRFLPCVNIYRLDGINIATELGDWTDLPLDPGRSYRARMRLDDLNLGNGTYLASAVLYQRFDPHLVEAPVVFDWIDRSVEFQVVGNPPAITSIFQHPSEWTVDEDGR